jgi:hypothetical protein
MKTLPGIIKEAISDLKIIIAAHELDMLHYEYKDGRRVRAAGIPSRKQLLPDTLKYLRTTGR